jgi:hypothetical protein
VDLSLRKIQLMKFNLISNLTKMIYNNYKWARNLIKNFKSTELFFKENYKIINIKENMLLRDLII